MPEMDGIACCRPRGNRTPILWDYHDWRRNDYDGGRGDEVWSARLYPEAFSVEGDLPVLDRALACDGCGWKTSSWSGACASEPPNLNRPIQSWKRFRIRSPMTCGPLAHIIGFAELLAIDRREVFGGGNGFPESHQESGPGHGQVDR